jgi:hypothetical protein
LAQNHCNGYRAANLAPPPHNKNPAGAASVVCGLDRRSAPLASDRAEADKSEAEKGKGRGLRDLDIGRERDRQ